MFPLSSSVVMESLSHLLRIVAHDGCLMGLIGGDHRGEAIKVSQLLFGHDILILCGIKEDI